MPQRTRIQSFNRGRLVRRRRNGRTVTTARGPDSITVGTVRLNPNTSRIPIHSTNPKVQRRVRIVKQLTATAPTFTLTYSLVADQDATDYTGSAVPRYTYSRVLQAYAWVETPPPSASVPSFGVSMQDLVSAVNFSDRPVSGSTYAGVGMRFCLETRQNQVVTTSTLGFCQVGTDSAIPSGTVINTTVDVLCEFS